MHRIRHSSQGTTGTREALRAIFNRNFIVVSCVNLLVMTAYYLTFVTSSAYAQAIYGVAISTAGFTAGIMVIGCVVGRFVTGNLLSLYGCRGVLFAGLLFYSLSMAAFFLVSGLVSFFAQRLCMGIGVGVIGAVMATLVAYVTPREHQGLGISLFSMSTVFALALGPFLAILLSSCVPYQMIVWICLFLGVACNGISFCLRDLPEMRHRHRSFFALYSYIDLRVIRFSLVALLVCLSYGCVQAFMTSFAAERGLTSAASFFFLCYALMAIMTRPLAGRLFDVRGENVVIFPSLLLTALALTLLAHAYSHWTLLLAGLTLGAGFANFQSSGQAVALSLVSRSRFPQANTTFFIFFDLGIGLGPYLFGFLVASVGYGGMYQALAGVVLASVLAYYLLHGRGVRYEG